MELVWGVPGGTINWKFGGIGDIEYSWVLAVRHQFWCH